MATALARSYGYNATIKEITMQALTNDQLHRIAPSIFARESAGGLSEKYRFVPTIDVVEALRGEGFFPVAVAASRCKTDDGIDYVKHTLRLRREADLDTKLARVGQVLPELALTNSHNGTSGFLLDPALHRLVCSNGLICAEHQGTLRFRHTGKDDLVGRVLEGAYEIVEDFPRLADKVEEWSGIQLNEQQRLAYAKAALPLRFDEESNVRPDQLLVPHRYADRKPDVFSTLNVVQENIIRGGIYTGRKNGRRQTTRKVTSVDRDLKLNRALWTLADELAKAVTQ